MEENFNKLNFNYDEIPRIFRSFDSGKYLDKCIICEKNLMDENTHYMIEKAIKKYPGYNTVDVIFEYAICLECAEEMRKTMSQESQQRITAYFDEHTDLFNRWLDFSQKDDFNIDDWLDNCLITGSKRDELEQYQVYAQCVGNQMIYSFFPFMISESAIEDMQELLSKKTRDEMDGFIDEHFGLPPEIRKLIRDPILV